MAASARTPGPERLNAAATRNPVQLEKLSRYADEWRYDTPADEDPEATWQKNRTTGEDVTGPRARARSAD